MSTKPNHARAYAKVTQRQLATKIRKPQWWVARIESGSRRVDVAEFVVFCEGCGVDPAKAITQLRRSR